MAYDRETISKLIARFKELAARAAVLQEEYRALDDEAAAIRLLLSKSPDVSLDEAIKHVFDARIPNTKKPQKLADRILDVMRKYDDPVSPSKIAEIIGGPMGSEETRSLRGKISAELTKLQNGDDAKIVKVGRAMYVLKDKPEGEKKNEPPNESDGPSQVRP